MNTKKQQTENLKFAAFPTHPIQDNLGQIIMHLGLTKIELGALIVGGHIYQAAQQQQSIDPEVIAEEAVSVAKAILLQCNQESEEGKNSNHLIYGNK